jgi:hypothetical protein
MWYRQHMNLKIIVSTIMVGVMFIMTTIILLFSPSFSHASDYEARILEYHKLNPDLFGTQVSELKRQAGGYMITFENMRIELLQGQSFPTELQIGRVGRECFIQAYGKSELPETTLEPVEEAVDFYETQTAALVFEEEPISETKGKKWLFGDALTGKVTLDDFPVQPTGVTDVQWFERALFNLSDPTNVKLLPVGKWLLNENCQYASNDTNSRSPTPTNTTTDKPPPSTPSPVDVEEPGPGGPHPNPTDTPLPDPYTPWTPTARAGGGGGDTIPVVTPTLTTATPVVYMFTDVQAQQELFAREQQYRPPAPRATAGAVPAPAPTAATPGPAWVDSGGGGDDSSDDDHRRDEPPGGGDGGAPAQPPDQPDEGDEGSAPQDPPKRPADPPKQPADPPKEAYP